MGVRAQFIAINDEDWEMLTTHPEHIAAFVDPDIDISDETGELNVYECGEKEIDIDKTWQVIHFMLTGVAWGIDGGEEPNRSVIWGGRAYGDVGCSPASFVEKEMVHNIHTFLQQLPEDFVETHYNIETFREYGFYPGSWKQRPPEFLTYFKENFDKLKAFYRFAAEHDLSVIQMIG